MISGCRHASATLVLWVLAGLSGQVVAADDWRLELLKQKGFSDKTEDLELLLGRQAAAAEKLNSFLIELESDDYHTRERAQASILMAGDAASSWIKGMPRQENPEVRFRLVEISEQLQNRGAGSQIELLAYAAKSLLEERKGNGDRIAPTRVFAEWFSRDANPLVNQYGLFDVQHDPGMAVMVKGGCLKFPGDRVGDGDQALILKASALGLKAFPKKFRVSCLIGGDSGSGAGLWHAGVSVGKVRVLYHPGMKGGAFRLETTVEKKAICANKLMGFDPSTTTMQRFELVVTLEDSGNVEFDVRIASSDGKQVFHRKESVDAIIIGAIDRVGLWRSGHRGASALFDDFVLDFRQ